MERYNWEMRAFSRGKKMDPALAIWLEIIIYALLLFSFMYFVAVKGPIARKVKEWTRRAVEARGRREPGEPGRRRELPHRRREEETEK